MVQGTYTAWREKIIKAGKPPLSEVNPSTDKTTNWIMCSPRISAHRERFSSLVVLRGNREINAEFGRVI